MRYVLKQTQNKFWLIIVCHQKFDFELQKLSKKIPNLNNTTYT